MSATIVVARIQWWALPAEPLSYDLCGSGRMCDSVRIGCRGESQSATQVSGPPAHEPHTTARPDPMVGPETPGPVVQIVWVGSAVGLG